MQISPLQDSEEARPLHPTSRPKVWLIFLFPSQEALLVCKPLEIMFKDAVTDRQVSLWSVGQTLSTGLLFGWGFFFPFLVLASNKCEEKDGVV